jgi:DNA polymerase (family X)
MKGGVYVYSLAKELERNLSKYCKKIEVAGSIRRKEKNPRDIDIVLIPKDREKILEILNKKGKFLQGGEKRSTFKINRIKVELYYTTPQSWGATLLAYSSRKGSAIGLRIFARFRGFKLNQYGLFKKGKMIAGKTEQEIYKALGKRYKQPKDR